jgi:hypothetical protein
MAAPSPRVLKTDTSAPRVYENNHNNSNQPPRVIKTTTTTTTTTALDQLRNRLRIKSVHDSGGSRPVRTNLVRKLKSITEENLPFTTGTTIRKSFKKGTLNGKIASYDKEREYYMIEYEDGDSEELRHKTVERYINKADTAIDQLKRLTRSRLQAKTAVQNNKNNNNQPTMEPNTTNKLPPHHAMAVFDETTGKKLEYRHLIKHKDPEVRKKWQLSGANEFGRTMQGVGKTYLAWNLIRSSLSL